MGTILINAPDIPDSELVYDEDETRQILKFFWPMYATAIDGLEINNDTRRLAQTMLIAAVDGSYAMGYIEALFNGITHRNRDVISLVRRLGRNFARHWWHHARQQDLEDAHIYESVRAEVARQLKWRLELVLNGIALNRATGAIHLAAVTKIGRGSRS